MFGSNRIFDICTLGINAKLIFKSTFQHEELFATAMLMFRK